MARTQAPVSLTPEELLAVLGKARERRLRDWVILVTIYWHGFRASEVVRSSTRQLGLFFTRVKAEQCQAEAAANEATIREVQRKVKGKPRICYLVESAVPVTRKGLTPEVLEGREILVKRLKHSVDTTQLVHEHENPLLSEKLAWDEWLAERNQHGKHGGAKRPQNHVSVQNQQTDSLFNISRWQLGRIYKTYAREAGLPKRKQHPHCLRHTIATDLLEDGVSLPQIQVHLGHKSLASTGVYILPKEDAVARAVGRAIRRKAEFRRFQQGALFPEDSTK